MVKASGARVVTTVGSDAKAEAARQLGADLAINYKTQDVDATIKQFAPQGVNIFWETLREPDFDRAVALLAPRGRMVIMAVAKLGRCFPSGRSTSRIARCSALRCSTRRPPSNKCVPRTSTAG